MKITDILSQDDIAILSDITDKKQLLGELADMAAAKTKMDKTLLLDALIERERLGTTGIGRGVALPHTRLSKLKKIFCAFVRTNPVDFESVDDIPVDMAFLLLVPEAAGADHLKALARLSRMLRNEENTVQLRSAKSPDDIYKIITQNDTDDE